jgi:translation initiation factor IF-1
MAKENGFEVEGEVVDCLPNATFKVKLDYSGTVIMSYLSGKMRQHQIRILMGDRVKIEMSPYDMTKGRIIHRN